MSQWVIGPCPGCIDEARPASDAPAPPPLVLMCGPSGGPCAFPDKCDGASCLRAIHDTPADAPREMCKACHGHGYVHNPLREVCKFCEGTGSLAASPAQEATPPREQSCDCDECLASRGKLRDDAGPAQEAPPYTTTSIDLPVESVNGQLVATPPREWSGIWNNWIAPFHACPRCGASLNWKQGEDALERPLITASHCGVYFSAPMAWRAE